MDNARRDGRKTQLKAIGGTNDDMLPTIFWGNWTSESYMNSIKRRQLPTFLTIILDIIIHFIGCNNNEEELKQ